MKLQRTTARSKTSQAKKQPAFRDTMKKILKKTSKIFQKKPKEEQQQTNEQLVKDAPAVPEEVPVKKRCPMRRKKRTESSASLLNDGNMMQKKTKNSWTKHQSSASGSQGEAQIAFFCSNDKYFNSCDDNEMIEMIQVKYPNFMRYGTDDNEMKKTLIMLFQDKPFVDEFLEFYNISIQDFFKFIFRNEMSVFKGPYISKISKILKDVGYEV